MARRFDEAFGRFDLLAMPTSPTPAPRFGETAVRQASGDVMSRELVRITRLFNANGLPAISVPCGFSAEGLPIGLQLQAPPLEEDRLLRAAHMFQKATDWHTRRPDLA